MIAIREHADQFISSLHVTALLLHRIHFAFTITYHYLFPRLTMGLALLIMVLKTIAIRRKERALQPGRVVLGKDFCGKVFNWCGHRNSDGISVWHQLVAIRTDHCTV